MCIQKHFGNNCALLELILTIFIEDLVKYTARRKHVNLLAFLSTTDNGDRSFGIRLQFRLNSLLSASVHLVCSTKLIPTTDFKS
jgi:hypothetical protein